MYRTEIKPGKRSDTRIRPLPCLANGNGRCMAITTEQALLSVWEWPLHMNVGCKFITVSLLKRLHNDRFTSETATWIQTWLKKSVGLELLELPESSIHNSFSRRGRWACYGNMYKTPGGSKPNLSR